MKEINRDEFSQVELCTGTIIEVSNFPEARKAAWKLHIDFETGIGTDKSNARLTDRSSKEDLLGRQNIAMLNLPTKQIAPFSQNACSPGFCKKTSPCFWQLLIK